MRILGILTVAATVAQAQIVPPTVTKRPDGMTTVVNRGPSRWPGTSGWKLELERTITPEEGSPGMLARPYSIVADAAGRIVVFDWTVKKIIVFDSTGRFIRTIGREGQGPGEFEPPVDLTVRGDTLGGYAMNQRRSLLWRMDGTNLAQWISAPCCSDGRIVLDGRGHMLVPQTIRVDGGDRRAMGVWTFDGRMVDTILLPPADARVVGWKMANGGMAGRPFTPFRYGAFDSRLRYVHGHGGSYGIVFATTGADTSVYATLPGARMAVPEKLRDSLYQRAASNPRILDRVSKDDIPKEHPYFTDLLLDERDHVWIARPGPTGETTTYDIVDPGGRFLGTVAAPPATALSRRPALANGRMYRIVENADGIPVIEVYRVNRGRY